MSEEFENKRLRDLCERESRLDVNGALRTWAQVNPIKAEFIRCAGVSCLGLVSAITVANLYVTGVDYFIRHEVGAVYYHLPVRYVAMLP